MSGVEMRAFERHDWDCFAGAAVFPDGSPPLIGGLLVDGHEATGVVDADGVFITWEVDGKVFGSSLRSPLAARAMVLLKGKTTAKDLATLGFTTEEC